MVLFFIDELLTLILFVFFFMFKLLIFMIMNNSKPMEIGIEIQALVKSNDILISATISIYVRIKYIYLRVNTNLADFLIISNPTTVWLYTSNGVKLTLNCLTILHFLINVK